MKKQLLFTFAFIATLFSATAQSNTLTYTGSGSDSETFLFGSSAGVYSISGSDFTEGAAFISYNSEVASGSPVSETMGINTSGSDVDATLTFIYRKRASMTGVVRISVPGQPDVTYDLVDTSAEDGGTNTLVERTLEYPNIVGLSSTATNVTISIDELAQNGVNNVRFRLYGVTVNGSLGINDFDRAETSVKLYPNPAVNSFQIETNSNINTVELYNITGQLVKAFTAEANYDISDLTSGIYLAKVKTELGSNTIRVIKK